MDTVEANEQLGFAPDLREYGLGAQILLDVGVGKFRFLTNNPRKVVGLEGYGLEMVEQIPIVSPAEPAQRALSKHQEAQTRTLAVTNLKVQGAVFAARALQADGGRVEGTVDVEA